MLQGPPPLLSAALLLPLLLLASITRPSQSEILHLTDATFDAVLSTFSPSSSVLVLFKADRCRHCLRMMPEYERLSDDPVLKGGGGAQGATNSRVIVTAVDAESNRGLALRFGVRSYPTLLYLRNDSVYHYRDERTHRAMRSFVLKGYENQGDGEAVPPPISWRNRIQYWGRAAWAELIDAASGEMGVLGYAMVVLAGFVAGLVLVAIGVAIVLFGRRGIGDKKEY